MTRNSFAPVPTLSPRTVSTAIAKAASVAIGIPQPSPVPVPAVITRKISTGTSTPPAAARIGSAAARGWRRSPTISSRLISSEMTKKKIAIRPSFTQ